MKLFNTIKRKSFRIYSTLIFNSKRNYFYYYSTTIIMTPEFFYIIILILTGMGVGFTTGLLGVGGGFITVPILFFLLVSIGVDSTLSIRMAFATSLAVIVPTAISSAYGHNRKHKLVTKAVIFLGISGFSGGIVGAYIATHTPGYYLEIIFALVLLLVALRMLLFKEINRKNKIVENIPQFIVWGLFAGLMSGLVGIGGAVILIPVMVLLMGFSMDEAGGNSSAIIAIISFGGLLSYILTGLNISGLPAYSLGYVNLLQFGIIALFSIPMAQVGAWVSHKLPEKLLRYIFIVLLVYISLNMLGIVHWMISILNSLY